MTDSWNRQKILELANGFRGACAVAAGADLEIWNVLGADRLAAAEVAKRLRGDLRATTLFLDALAALGLLEKTENRYRVPEELRPLLSSAEGSGGESAGEGPGSEPPILPMLQHLANVLRGWAHLAWVVRSGIPAPRIASIRGFEADQAAFIAGMHAISAPIADQIVAELGPPRFRHLLDVGGGSGTWTLAFLRAVPTAQATIFDLPCAIQQAEVRIGQSPLRDRIRLVTGNFYHDPLPSGADLAWVSAIVHQHSRAHNRELFAKVFAALDPGGRIAIRDMVMQPDRTRPVNGALFAINMLVNTESGGTYTFEELAEDLHAVGFQDAQWVLQQDMNSVVMAKKPTP